MLENDNCIYFRRADSCSLLIKAHTEICGNCSFYLTPEMLDEKHRKYEELLRKKERRRTI